MTVLLASHSGNVDWVKNFLQEGSNPNERDEDGYTSLHHAAQNGFVPIVQLLLESGANINAWTKDEQTPLHVAARNGHSDVVKLLLEAKAEPSKEDLDGLTALHLAAISGQAEVVVVMALAGVAMDPKTKSLQTPLHLAAYGGHSTAVTSLLLHGANVDALDEGQCSPLHYAASEGHYEATLALLKAGARLDLGAQGSNSARSLASAANHSVVACLLDMWELTHIASPHRTNPAVSQSQENITSQLSSLQSTCTTALSQSKSAMNYASTANEKATQALTLAQTANSEVEIMRQELISLSGLVKEVCCAVNQLAESVVQAESKAQKVEVTAQQAESMAKKAEIMAQQADDMAQQAEITAQQAGAKSDSGEEVARQALKIATEVAAVSSATQSTLTHVEGALLSAALNVEHSVSVPEPRDTDDKVANEIKEAVQTVSTAREEQAKLRGDMESLLCAVQHRLLLVEDQLSGLAVQVKASARDTEAMVLRMESVQGDMQTVKQSQTCMNGGAVAKPITGWHTVWTYMASVVSAVAVFWAILKGR